MRRTHLITLLAGALTAGPAPPADADAPSGEAVYRVEPAESLVYVRVKPDASGLLAGLSHAHVVRASTMTGEIRWDPAHPEACRVRIDVPASSLRVDEPELRKKVGLEGTLDDDDREEIAASMRDEDQLYVSMYPNLSFEARTCEVRSGADVVVVGDLEIRGKKKEIRILMKVDIAQDGLRARGDISLLHRHFGFEPYSAALGAVANDESLRFVLDVRARKHTTD